MSNEMDGQQYSRMRGVLEELSAERLAQHAKWGEQNHPSFSVEELKHTPPEEARELADDSRRVCQAAFKDGNGSFSLILLEEFGEALGEMHTADDEQALRGELVQVGAVVVAWIEAIDRRRAK